MRHEVTGSLNRRERGNMELREAMDQRGMSNLMRGSLIYPRLVKSSIAQSSLRVTPRGQIRIYPQWRPQAPTGPFRGGGALSPYRCLIKHCQPIRSDARLTRLDIPVWCKPPAYSSARLSSLEEWMRGSPNRLPEACRGTPHVVRLLPWPCAKMPVPITRRSPPALHRSSLPFRADTLLI